MGDFLSNITNVTSRWGGMPSVVSLVPGESSGIPVATSASSGPSGWSGWIQTLLGTGVDVYKTKTAADIASAQIKAGQYPTAIGQNGNLSGTANVSPYQQAAGAVSTGISGSMLTIGGILLVVLLLFAVIGRK